MGFRGILVGTLTACALAPCAQGEWGTYTVQRGDTLFSIARHCQVTVEALREANHLAPEATLAVGLALRLPAAVAPPTVASQGACGTYQVQPGDSLSRIAQHFGLSAAKLADANGLSSDTILQIGQRLSVPGLAPAPAPSQPVAAAAAPAPTALISFTAPLPQPAAASGKSVPATAPAAPAPSKPTHVMVGSERVKAHATPSMEGKQVRLLEPGTQLAIVAQHGDWWQVKLPGGDQTAFVADWVVKPVGGEGKATVAASGPAPQLAAATPPSGVTPQAVPVATRAGIVPPMPVTDANIKPLPPTPTTASIAEERVNLRSGPSTDTEKVTVLTRGTPLHVMQVAGDWVRVKVGDACGWVARSLTSLADHVATGTGRAGRLVQAALGYLGAPYRRGGTSRDGVDCSGLVYAAAREIGVSLPRTSSEMWGKGSPVAKGNLRPGDVVFFKDTYRRGISHVGLYLGDDKFVHAPRTGKSVMVSNLGESYYTAHWAGAYRILE